MNKLRYIWQIFAFKMTVSLLQFTEFTLYLTKSDSIFSHRDVKQPNFCYCTFSKSSFDLETQSVAADVFPAVEILNIVLIIEQRQSIMELCRYSIKQIDRFMIDLHSFVMNWCCGHQSCWGREDRGAAEVGSSEAL